LSEERIYDCSFVYGPNVPYDADVCERFRLCFMTPRYLIAGQYGFVRQTFEKFGGAQELGVWRFPYDSVEPMVIELEKGGYAVDTIAKAIDWLKRRMYNPSMRQDPGEDVFTKLPDVVGSNWSYLDSGSRSWGPVRIEKDAEEGAFCFVPRWTALKHLYGDDESYYLVQKGSDPVPVSKRAAIALASRTFKTRTIGYSISGDYLAVRRDEVGALPDDVFSLAVRMRPTKEHKSDLYLFLSRDRDMVSELFSLVNLSIKEGAFRMDSRKKYARRRGFSFKDDEREFLRSRRW
jgi:hypothetical protein